MIGCIVMVYNAHKSKMAAKMAAIVMNIENSIPLVLFQSAPLIYLQVLSPIEADPS